MKNKKLNYSFYKIGGLLVLLLSFYLNTISSNRLSQIPFKYSSKTQEVVLNNNSQFQFTSASNSVNLFVNLFFEFNEDDDNDEKQQNYIASSLLLKDHFDSPVVSGIFYFNSFLFFEKTPRFILYQNSKAFLS